jgi:C4-type Zn-finger protein
VSSAIVSVGFTCPLCGARVAVLRSCDPAPHATDVIRAECACGFVRFISVIEIQSLEVWRGNAA